MGVTGEGIEAGDRIDLVAEKFQADGFFIGSGGINFDYVAARAESSAREIHVVALV